MVANGMTAYRLVRSALAKSADVSLRDTKGIYIYFMCTV